MLVAAQLIAAAALSREESRGGHYRVDFPTRQPALDGCHTLTLPRAAIPDHMREAVTHA
jgi:succinate dehydrogenase/fumarate reductase flavoprotein subunit